MSFLIAHLSDPHLPPLPRPGLAALASKRALGYINWRRNRASKHRPHVLERLVADVIAQGPDHIVVTGDLTNLALDAEFNASAEWLSRFGPGDRVTVVPGNHDAYVPGALARGLERWHAHTAARAPLADAFPAVRRTGPVAVIGLNSAVPTAPFVASGRLGAGQLARLEGTLTDLGRAGLARIVLVHHPLEVERRHWSKRLVDADALAAVLARAGAELVLHGHMHVPSLHTVEGPTGHIPVLGVPSASADPEHNMHGAGYALCRIEAAAPGWTVDISRRTLAAQDVITESAAGRFTLGRA